MKAAILALSCAAALGAAGAQPPVCDSAALRAPIGTQTDTLRVFLRRADLSGPLPDAFALSALDGLRQAFVFPPNMAFDAYVSGEKAGTAVATARSTALFEARRDGSADFRGMLARSGSDRLDASLANAIRSASDQRAFAPFPKDLGRDVLLVAELYFGVGDSLRAGMDVAALQLPVYRDFSELVAPPEPGSARDQRSLVQAIALVDAAGRVRSGFVDFFVIQDLRFAAQLLERLKAITSVPARIAGCPVPTLKRFVLVPPN